MISLSIFAQICFMFSLSPNYELLTIINQETVIVTSTTHGVHPSA